MRDPGLYVNNYNQIITGMLILVAEMCHPVSPRTSGFTWHLFVLSALRPNMYFVRKSAHFVSIKQETLVCVIHDYFKRSRLTFAQII